MYIFECIMTNREPQIKSNLHLRNKHRAQYNIDELTKAYPQLNNYVILNQYKIKSVDFFNPDAVKALNTALLLSFYKIEYWDFPKGYLCPPIPGRVDYIHYLADLLSETFKNEGPKGDKIKCLDIGTGANCIYPILGSREYDWSFVASDVDNNAVASARKIIDSNLILKDKIEIRLQENPKHIFNGIIQDKEFYHLTICNPPFHKSKANAETASLRKLRNLNAKDEQTLNFAGQSNELWCTGGEKMFIKNMIKESKRFANSCRWFTSLVSRGKNLNSFYDLLEKTGAKDVKTIDMSQGNKKSRILAWTFADL